jgi:cyclic beta-1,2-glucan synthetase
VLSKAAEPLRAERAMASLDRHLIRRDEGLALLFTPPFDHTEHDPGYIKGYPPGVRENGGQYTHAATWSVIAFAALGEGDKAAELLAMLNPINHARTPADVERYKVEPYVIAADIYSVAPHVGRGGWTWYTGSAGWLQRAGVESVLGIRLRGGAIEIDPCIPKSWSGFEATVKRGSSRYRIQVENPDKVCRGIVAFELDGVAMDAAAARTPLIDDGAAHQIKVRLG